MPAVDIVNQQGEKVGQMDLADAIFGAPVKDYLLWEVVKAQRASWRKGTASTKGRSEVKGSTHKLYRQKGTGRARQGSVRSPVHVGGGTVFGPKPRKYDKKVPKKVRRGALISALSLRAAESRLVVVDDLSLGEIKTKRMARVLDALGVESGLIVESRENDELIKSVRNLARSKYIAPEGLNVYDLLKYPALVVSASAVKQIEERLK